MTPLPPPTPPSRRSPLRDLLGGTEPYDAAIRAARTGLQAAVAALLMAGVFDVPAVEAAGFAALTAVLTLLQGMLGRSGNG